jgi:Protein of unknown function (DUF3631)
MRLSSWNVPAFCPKAISKIGKMTGRWATVASRSVTVQMRRRLRSEHIERLRFKRWNAEAEPLRRKLARFASDYSDTLTASEPALPEQLGDRQQESWLPLLAIADAAGGDWPEAARAAAVALCAGGFRTEDSALSELLLRDIRDTFAARENDGTAEPDRITSKELCKALAELESRPWAEFGEKEKEISPNKLATLLDGYGIKPRQMKLAGKNRNGYVKTDFADAWERYSDDTPSVPAPNYGTSKVYPVYQADSKEVKCDFKSLPDGNGRVSISALKPNEINVVETVDFRSPQKDGVPEGYALPAPKRGPAPEPPSPIKPFQSVLRQIAKRNAEAGELVEQYRAIPKDRLPDTAFELRPGTRILDPPGFFRKLDSDVHTGNDALRARIGDLKDVVGLFGDDHEW